MSKETKSGLKWTIGILVGLIVIVGFTFSMGVGWAQNSADHNEIRTEQNAQGEALKAEIDRATEFDTATMQSQHRMERTQDVILEKVNNIEKKL